MHQVFALDWKQVIASGNLGRLFGSLVPFSILPATTANLSICLEVTTDADLSPSHFLPCEMLSEVPALPEPIFSYPMVALSG